MEHIRLTAISLSLLLCTVSAFAQRHYENIPALELNYGTNLCSAMQATITTCPFPDTSTGQAIGKPGLAILRNLTNTQPTYRKSLP